MAYNSKYTGAQVEALLDRAGTAPQIYDIGWLMNLISASEDNIATLTAEQFNEIKAAADAGKIFMAGGEVYSSVIGNYKSNLYILFSGLGDGGLITLVVASRNGTYQAASGAEKIITQDDLIEYAKTSDLTGYAKSSDVPTKTSQLTNDSNFLTEIPIANDTKIGGIKVSTNSGYSISNTGLFELNSATSTSKGIVSIGTGLTVNSGEVTLNTATSSNLGGVIVPDNGTISVDTSGNISVSDKVALKTDLDSKQDAITYSSSSNSSVTLTANSLIDLGTRNSAITVLLPSTASSDHKEY